MSMFLSGLDASLFNDDSVWILNKPLVYWSDLINYKVVVPAGFQTDFASVPRMPIIYTAFGDRAHREAVIHDYLFRKDSKPVVEFMTANRIFLEAMQTRGKHCLIRWPMFLGVSFGSFFAFHKKKVFDKI